jgi:hypothetical protein
MTGRKVIIPRVMELRAMMGTSPARSDRLILAEELLDAIDRAQDMEDVRRILKALVENLLMEP